MLSSAVRVCGSYSKNDEERLKARQEISMAVSHRLLRTWWPDKQQYHGRNAIRSFAIGRKNWLFADIRKGAEARAACYSLIETAKANNLDPQAHIKHILDHITAADIFEKLEALLPWNVKLS